MLSVCEAKSLLEDNFRDDHPALPNPPSRIREPGALLLSLVLAEFFFFLFILSAALPESRTKTPSCLSSFISAAWPETQCVIWPFTSVMGQVAPRPLDISKPRSESIILRKAYIRDHS